MNIYVAGRFHKKDEILKVYEILEKKGHSISYDWTTHKGIKPYEENPDMAHMYSENECQGLLETDVFVYWADEKGTTILMEFGAALVLKKLRQRPMRVCVVGETINESPWFFNKDVERFDSVEQLLSTL